MEPSSRPAARADECSLKGKYLAFALGQERYAMQILKVQEIIGPQKITRVPKSEAYLKGVLNLRGKIIPVVDLRLRLDMPERPVDEKTCFIVVNVELNGQSVGLAVVVDTVLEVLTFSEEEIQCTPDYGSQIDTAHILGIGKQQDQLTILIDITSALGGARLP